MTKYRLEYIWLDGYTPVPNLRGKTQLKDFDAFPTLAQQDATAPKEEGADSTDGKAPRPAVAKPAAMNASVATIERGDARAIPHTPWPLVHPPP